MRKRVIITMFAAFSVFMMSNIAVADTVGVPPVYSSGPCTGYADDVYGNDADEYRITVENEVKEIVVVPVYCFYSSTMRDYFWTASENEMNQLLKDFNEGTGTYQYQGISGHAEQTPDKQNLPVYRFWNKRTMDHFYTTSETEKEQLLKDYDDGKDWYEYEGVAWYVPKTSDVPVYRFYDVRNFNHYYTSDEQLKENLYQTYMNGTGVYRYEGIAWYWYQ